MEGLTFTAFAFSMIGIGALTLIYYVEFSANSAYTVVAQSVKMSLIG
jgi:hypothetical protein